LIRRALVVLLVPAREMGVTFVSTAISREESSPDFFIPDGWHPSARGHRHLAERIAKEIVGAGLLDR
jgi:lysophospholipase L1-like esterase